VVERRDSTAGSTRGRAMMMRRHTFRESFANHLL
jgi:hypothetical protein